MNQTQPIDFTAGDTYTALLTIKNSSGAPLNLTGGTFAFEARRPGSSTAAFSVSNSGFTVSAPTTGKVTFVIAASLTASLIPDNLTSLDLAYVLRYTNSLSQIFTLLSGPLKLRAPFPNWVQMDLTNLSVSFTSLMPQATLEDVTPNLDTLFEPVQAVTEFSQQDPQASLADTSPTLAFA